MIESAIKKLEQSDWLGAIELLTKGIESGSDQDFRAHYFLGIAYRKAGKLNLSINCLRKASELSPKNANILSELGISYFQKGDKKQSLSYFDDAVALEPHNSYRYSSRAYIKGALNMLEEAIADYEKAVALDPKDSIAYNNLGLLLERKGRINEAKENFQKSDEHNSSKISDDEKERLRQKAIEESKRLGNNQSEKTTAPKKKLTMNFYLKTIKETFLNQKEWNDFVNFLFRKRKR